MYLPEEISFLEIISLKNFVACIAWMQKNKQRYLSAWRILGSDGPSIYIMSIVFDMIFALYISWLIEAWNIAYKLHLTECINIES